ncbi:DNA-binding PucR family transcriptional regulator [Lentzea atacamensis]|uniref:DNA-binding PucR family transcriptional regulator n=2 Tax=Lentzea TaxID=165301 RepID=A0A316HM69_9PSEU|nr:helix-turn-helix domain-containing protein [Lentzea atacamensis]PWK81815.1 DNA-binding PucR family transcriptional regulator [Lentzea atacamensis]RAS63019.1 DNA-binding PucR family transcriptional regulator [Lentzea atacamensis]
MTKAAEAKEEHPPTLSARTMRKIERASGALATASVAEMEQRLPWFARMPADQRASVLLLIQNGVAGFVEWLHDRQQAIRLTADAFRSAPKDISRWVSLRQTVELVRIALEHFEEQMPAMAGTEAERALLMEGVLRYGREIAFSAATSYAAAAEARGAWDARLEALVVDGVVRGDPEESLLSRAAALGWDPALEATVLVGNPGGEDPPAIIYSVRSKAARAGRPVLLSVQGSRLVVVLGGPTETGEDVLGRIAEGFGEGPVVAGPTVASLAEAHRSASDALSGLRAVVGWPAAPRPVRSLDLLPERALAGDPEAEWQLVDRVARPLEDAGGALLETVDAFLEVGGVLETCAKRLFVHPNTVRYRLRRVQEMTGRNAHDARDALVLRVALSVGRLARARGLW